MPRQLIAFLVLVFAAAGSSPANAEGACFPACRSGFVCAPDGKCVSLCNPPCSASEVCSGNECRAKKRSSNAASTEAPSTDAAAADEKSEKTGTDHAVSNEPLPERHYELGLGLGYQHVGSLDYFAPALAFHYVLALGLEPHLLFGVRAGAALGSSTIAELGLDLGYRHRLAGC